MYDGAPSLRLKVVLECLLENRKSKVEVLDWPGNSSYLNPIENLWSYIKNKVAKKQPSSAKELITAIKEVWVKQISTKYILCITSKKYTQAVAAVVSEKGGHTKY